MNGAKLKELEDRIKRLERIACCCCEPPGPYTNDAAAEAAGVKVGEMYYQDDGTLVVRLV